MTIQQTTREQEFRVCPQCGNLTPAKRPDCMYCGALTVEAMAEQQEAEHERRFLAALIMRATPFALLIIGINAGVFFLEWLAGGMGGLSADPQVIRAFGAKDNELINQQHQYWRLVTSIFLHIGFLHFLMNNYALWIIGQEIERIYGSARFVLLYLATGIVASLASYTFNPNAESAGASGAIFGLFGVMATFAFRYRKELPERLGQDIRRRILPVIAINLLFGFSVKIVDNSAHIGGLLAGVVLALVIPYQRPNERQTALIWRILQVICGVIILISFIAVFRSYDGPKLSAANLTQAPDNKAEVFIQAMRDTNTAMNEATKSFVKILNDQNDSSDLKPVLDQLQKAKTVASAAPAIDQNADHFKQRFIEMIDEERGIVERFASSNPKNRNEARQQQAAFNDHYKAFWEESDSWLTKFLKDHGYQVQNNDDNDDDK